MDDLEKLRVIIEAETAPLKKGVDSALQETRRLSSEVGKTTASVKNSFGKLGGFIKGALVGAIAFGAMKFGKTAIDLASDIDEVQNVVESAFGDMTPMVEKFASTAIDQFGLSALTAKRTASTYMAMSKGMGLTGEQAAKMSISVAQMTGDLSSFYNVSQDVADTALKSIWTGETESLKKFGVVMSQTNLTQFAMKNGMNANIQAMSQQEQMMLRYAFVMDALSLAHGDFAKTQDGWANQLRILSERFKEILSILGTYLVAALTPVVKFLNYVVSGIINVFRALNAVLGKFGIFKKSQGGVAKNQTQLANATDDLGSSGAGAMDKLGKATEKAGKKAKGALASFDELNVLTSSSADAPSSGGGSGSGGVGAPGGGAPPLDIDLGDTSFSGEIETGPLEKMFLDFFEKIQPFVQTLLSIDFTPLANAFKKLQTSIQPILAKIGMAIIWFLNEVVAPFAKWYTEELAPRAITLLANSLTVLNPILELVGKAGLWLYESFLKPIASWTADQLLEALDFINGGLEGIALGLEEFASNWDENGAPAFETLSILLSDVGQKLQEFWETVIQPIFSLLIGVVSDTVGIIVDAWKQHIGPVFELVIEILTKIYENAKEGYDTHLKPIILWLIEKIDQLWKKVLKPVFEFVIYVSAEVTKALLKFYNNAILPITKYLTDTLKPVFDLVFGAVKLSVDGAMTFLTNTMGGVIKTLKGVVDFVLGVFTGDWEKAWNGVVGIFRGIWETIEGVVKSVWGNILGLFSQGGKIFNGVVDGIATAFMSIVNALIDGINWVIAQPFNNINRTLNFIKGINILGAKPFDGFWGYNPIPVPKIPRLSVGTNYVAREGLAYIHEGEAVVPKKYNPALSGNAVNYEQIELLKEQNNLLRALLDKNNHVYLDGDEISDKSSKRQEMMKYRLGYE